MGFWDDGCSTGTAVVSDVIGFVVLGALLELLCALCVSAGGGDVGYVVWDCWGGGSVDGLYGWLSVCMPPSSVTTVVVVVAVEPS